jgi:hypothetical protein
MSRNGPDDHTSRDTLNVSTEEPSLLQRHQNNKYVFFQAASMMEKHLRRSLVMAEKWNLTGTYCEACNCEVACPCVFLSAPTGGDCTLLVGWHIDKGNFGNVDLGNLNVALAVHSPGHMAKVKWRAALYFDRNASEKQKNALTQIFTGQAGGHPGMLVSHIGDVLGIRQVPIEYKADGKRRTLKIADVAESEIEAIEGQGGGDVTVDGHPLCIAPGYKAVVAKSKKLNYQDHGLHWEISGKNGFFSPFSYQGK